MASPTDRRVKLAWLLTIGGLHVRYWCGQAPPLKNIWGGGPDYLDVHAIVPQRLGQQTAALDELGGIAKHGAVDVTLASRGQSAGAGDPRLILCRASKRGARRWTRLGTTLEHETTGGGAVEITSDPTAWPQLGGRYILHCGTEALTATGLDTAAPYGFTGLARAMLGSRPQEHLVDLTRGLQPTLYSDAVTWRTRRVTLSCAAITGKDLTDQDYREVLRGFIDSSPVLAADGLSVRLTLAPLTALLETGAANPRTTKLTGGWHDFGSGSAAATFAHTQMAFRGEVARLQVTNNAASGAASVQVGTATEWSENSDTGRASGHPRRLPMMQGQGSAEPTGVGGGPTLTFASPPGIPNAVGQNNIYVNDGAWEPKAVNITGLKQWPGDVLQALRDAWAPGTVAGADGAWVDVMPIDAGDGRYIQARCNGEAVAIAHTLEFRADWHLPGEYRHSDYSPTQPYMGFGVNEIAHYALQWCAPDGPWFDPRTRGTVGESIPRGQADRTRWLRAEKVDRVKGEPHRRYEIRGWPSGGWYQTGAPSFLCESQVMDPGATPQFALVTWRESGEERKQITRISSVSAKTDGTGATIGYTYTLASGWPDITRSFGDWPGEPRCEVRPVAAWYRRPAWEVLLSLLQSGRGRGTNGSYDTLPFGADLDDSEIDGASFAANGAIAITDEFSPVLLGDKPLKEYVIPLLRAMGCCLVMRNWQGQQLLGLARVGIATDESKATINSADIAIDGRPESGFEDRPVVRYRIECDHDVRTGEPRTVGTFVDASALSENGGDAGDEVKLELRGWRLQAGRDIVIEALPVVEAIKARMGAPRRRYAFTVPRGMGLSLSVGDVVTLTAPDAVGYDGTLGVSAVKCRVTSVTVMHGGERDGADVEVVSYEANTSGWAPAMYVATVVDADTITVSANRYSTSTSWLTGETQTDASFFRVGDAVELVPKGNWAGRSTGKTIASISGNTIGIVGHGASAGWSVRPAPYDSGTARMKGYVFAADASDTLGAAADEGKVWA